MKNKKIVIVGGTDGIGRALANHLVEHNEVLIIGRSEEKGKRFVAEHGKNANHLATDLSLMRNLPPLVKKIKSHFARVDFIVHTADVLKGKRTTTEEGLDISLAIKFYSRILFNQLMIGEEKGFQPERIIHVASPGYAPKDFMKNFPLKPNASSLDAHKFGQMANDYYGLLLQRKLRDQGTKVNILNPGHVSSNIHKNGELPILLRFLYPFIASIFVGKSRTPEEYTRLIPFHIMKDENKDANESILISSKGKKIEENKNVSEINTQEQLYDFAKEKIDSVLKNQEIKNWL